VRTGTWRDINRGGSTDPINRRYLTLYLAHSQTTPPAGSDYAYVVLPGATTATVAARAAAVGDWLTIHANNKDQQGISARVLGLTAVNFWNAGAAGPLAATAPASILTREHGTAGTLCVSDPTRTGEAFDVTWEQPVATVVSKDPAITVLHAGTSLKLHISPGTTRATHRCMVKLGTH
jgi:hyaluronate lyase